jgi:hypothetical protein
MSDNNAFGQVLTANIDAPEQSKTVASHMKNVFNLRIGGVFCAFNCHEGEDYTKLAKLKRRYRLFLTGQPTDITIELEGTDRLNLADLTAALAGNEYFHEENLFKSTSQVVSGIYDLTRGYIKIIGERGMANPKLEGNHLNQLLSLAYYSACKIRYNGQPPAMVMHACGILRSGQALLFTGPSDAGKTTIARMCGKRDGEVINDEMLLVTRPGQNGSGVCVESAPFIGRISVWRNVKAPLRCIFMLKKSSRTGVRRIDRSEAYLKLMRQIITPAYIGQKDKRAVISQMSEFSDEVTKAVPVYELEFSLDRKSLWETVRELESKDAQEQAW